MKLTCLLLAAAVALGPGLGAPLRAQPGPAKPAEQDPAVQLKAELIEVRAVVTDKRGQIIDGLKKEDFELLENNRPQELSFFAVERVGGAAGAAAPGKEVSPTPGLVRPADPPGRTVVLFVDTLHLSPSSLLRMKQTLKEFVGKQLSDGDLVALVTSGGRLGLLSQFTRDRQILRYAIDRLSPDTGSKDSFFSPYLAASVERGMPDALTVAIQILRIEENLSGPRDFLERMAQARARQVLAEAAYQRRATLLTLRAVAERMAEMPGQRLIALLSDGFTMMDTGGTPDTGDIQSVISRAVRSGVIIYSLDAKGLTPSPLFSAAAPGVGAGQASTLISSYVSAAESDQQDGLNALAKDTGGEAFFNTNDLGGALRKALDDNRLYYVLAYYPAGEAEGRQFRRITVRVKGHPEYQVRAQRGYQPSDRKKDQEVEAAATPQQQMARALVAPLPLTNIAVSAAAYYLELGDDNAQVSLEARIAGDTVEYRQQEEQHHFNLEVATVVYDARGNTAYSVSDKIEGKLRPERFAVARQSGFRVTKRITLKPGLYQLRLGVRDTQSGRMGTAVAWVEVPNINKGKLAMSSLFLAGATLDEPGAAEAGNVTLFPAKVAQGITFYRRGDFLVYNFMLYNAIPQKGQTLDLQMRVEIAQGEQPTIQGAWQPVAGRLLARDPKGLQVGGKVSLASLKPGIYELRVSLKDPKSKRPLQQSVIFGVEP